MGGQIRPVSTQVGAADCGPHPQQKSLCYPGIELQVDLYKADAIEAALNHAIKGWLPEVHQQAQGIPRRCVVNGTSQGYSTASYYLDETLDGLGTAAATCAVIADLAQDYFETRPGSLALHCAAFKFANRLIAMTGPSRAGKSTLAARLTAEEDMQVFCDDVLPMQADGIAVALGIAPRLRLPLPDKSNDRFRAHVAEHLNPCDDRYGYISAPTVARHGTRAPLSVLLILDRQSAGSAKLHEVAEDEALHFLLSQNMSDLSTADSAFDLLSELQAKVTCLRLVYSDLEDAVALIRKAFSADALVAPDVPIHPALPSSPKALSASDLSPEICWARCPDTILQTKGDSAFLWKPGTQVIWHMNMLSLAVWAMLEIPGSARDLAQVLTAEFPDQPFAILVSDVNALLQALAHEQLIIRDKPAADLAQDGREEIQASPEQK